MPTSNARLLRRKLFASFVECGPSARSAGPPPPCGPPRTRAAPTNHVVERELGFSSIDGSLFTSAGFKIASRAALRLVLDGVGFVVHAERAVERRESASRLRIQLAVRRRGLRDEVADVAPHRNGLQRVPPLLERSCRDRVDASRGAHVAGFQQGVPSRSSSRSSGDVIQRRIPTATRPGTRASDSELSTSAGFKIADDGLRLHAPRTRRARAILRRVREARFGKGSARCSSRCLELEPLGEPAHQLSL